MLGVQDEEFAHQADKEQMSKLAEQLAEAKTGMQGSGMGVAEAASRLQGQLQAAMQALQVSLPYLQQLTPASSAI